MILQGALMILKLAFWILLMPFFIGLLFNFILPRPRRTVGITFILGFLVYIAVFEIIAIPAMTRVMWSAFSVCRTWYTVITVILAILGIARSIYLLNTREKTFLTLFPGESYAQMRDLLNPRTDLRMFKLSYSVESRIYWGIFFAILLFQMIMSVVMSSFDGDDAYYVVESLLAQQADVMNTILPYTGSSTSLDIRHALAVITMWIAFIAKMSGVHATIVSHSVIPLFILPFTYLIYVEIGRIIFRTRQQRIPVYMLILSFLFMFGNVSIYTPATFLMMRTWQGKAMVANLVFPLIFWLFLWMMEDALTIKRKKPDDRAEAIQNFRMYGCPWVLMLLVNMFSGVCSSMGVIFGSGLTALLTLILLFVSRNLRHIIPACLCVLPNLLYLAFYFSLITT